MKLDTSMDRPNSALFLRSEYDTCLAAGSTDGAHGQPNGTKILVVVRDSRVFVDFWDTYRAIFGTVWIPVDVFLAEDHEYGEMTHRDWLAEGRDAVRACYLRGNAYESTSFPRGHFDAVG